MKKGKIRRARRQRRRKRHADSLALWKPEAECHNCGHVPGNDDTCACACHPGRSARMSTTLEQIVTRLESTSTCEQAVIAAAGAFVIADENTRRPLAVMNKDFPDDVFDVRRKAYMRLTDAVLNLDVCHEQTDMMPGLAELLPEDADPDEPQRF